MTSEFTQEDVDLLRNAAQVMAMIERGNDMNNIADRIQQMNAITKTRGPSVGSFNSLVAELQPGESVSKVRAVDPTITVARLPAEMPAIRTQVRNSVAPAVARAKELTGAVYTTEVGDVVMPGGSMYVVAVITRLDD